MENSYKYTLEKIIGHLVAIEEHLVDSQPCWADCLPKHLCALKLYLDEIVLLSEKKEDWNIIHFKINTLISTIIPDINVKTYIDEFRKLRKEIVEKFYYYGGN